MVLNIKNVWRKNIYVTEIAGCLFKGEHGLWHMLRLVRQNGSRYCKELNHDYTLAFSFHTINNFFMEKNWFKKYDTISFRDWNLCVLLYNCIYIYIYIYIFYLFI